MDAHDGSQGRARRPESSASSLSRFTPQSSNNSAANLHPRTQNGRNDTDSGHTQEGAAGSSLLQERLREKRAARLSERHKSVDIDALRTDQLIGTQSSPIGPGRTSRVGRDRDVQRPTSSGKGSGDRLMGKKGMGIKEMEETVSTLHKQNFDLKLELFHRRQRQLTLEERLEAAEAQIAEQAEMQTVNEQLLAELEKRDRAIEEAMSLICTLEEKVERLLDERNAVRAFDSQYESSYAEKTHDDVPSGQDPGSSLPQIDEGVTDVTKAALPRPAPRTVVRMPSFLSEQSEGTEALRSLYYSNDRHSEYGLPKLRNNEPYEGDTMDSPRLSVLSESSFLSVYGDKTLALGALDALDVEDSGHTNSPNHRRSQTVESVEKWVGDRAVINITPRKPSAQRGASFGKDQFLSLNNAMVSPLQRLEKMQHTLSKGLTSSQRLASDATVAAHKISGRQNKREDAVQRTDFDIFGSQQALPPTPDTFSTSAFRFHKGSNDTLERDAAQRSHELDRPLLDRAHTSPNFQDLASRRPRSAGETITSRRGGHGWDTATQSEFTDYNSDVDVEGANNFDPWIATGREASQPSRVDEPKLFTFSDNDDEWGRDMMFNRDNRLRPRQHMNSEAEPRSDNTVTVSSQPDRSRLEYQSQNISFPSIDVTPRPNPPERRSSLAGSPSGPGNLDKRTRKQGRILTKVPPPRAISPPQVLPKTSPEKESKRARITSRLFGLGRSESTNAPPPWNVSRSYSYSEQPGSKTNRRTADIAIEDLHTSASATPPPISRYPRGSTAGSGPGRDPRHEAARPTTARSMEGRPPTAVGKRESATRFDNAGERGWVADGLEGFGLGMDGSGDVKDEQQQVGADAGAGAARAQGVQQQQQGKKWFGLGRSGSLRR